MKKILVYILFLFSLILYKNLIAFEPEEEKHIKNIRQLTFGGDNAEAYFSFDGKKLIYQSNSPNGGESPVDRASLYECDKIWTMNIDGSEKKTVGPRKGAHTCAFFFPDGKRIIFSSTTHLQGDCPEKRPVEGHRYVWHLFPYDIYTANSDGSDLKKLVNNPDYDAEAIVSPDGKRIVFTSKRDGDLDIYIMDSDGSNIKRLTDRFGYDGGPWFSPDGKKIVWRAWYPETDEEKAFWKRCIDGDYVVSFPLDLWVMDVDGSNKRRILRNGATNFAPSWHPDNKRIIFSSNMDDWREDIKSYGYNFELYIINEDGTGLKRLTFNKAFDGFPMFSPDGRKLVFASNRDPKRPRDTDIFIADWVE
jgi:Tol biopolymer transport system component